MQLKNLYKSCFSLTKAFIATKFRLTALIINSIPIIILIRFPLVIVIISPVINIKEQILNSGKARAAASLPGFVYL